jgi:endonuclease/exonuclease/phosphatase family metal-dependent hydrolase
MGRMRKMINYVVLGIVAGIPIFAGAETQLQAVTFNLFHPPVNREARLEAAAETLAGLKPNVVFLQEVSSGGVLTDDPVSLIGKRLGMRGRVFFAYEDLFFYRQGSAILTTHPIIESRGYRFSSNLWYEKKGFVWAKIDTSNGPFHAVSVHMLNKANGEHGVKKNQLDELASFIQAKARTAPVLLAGDFNSELSSDIGFQQFFQDIGARYLFDEVPIGDVRTTYGDKQLLDYVFWIRGGAYAPGWDAARFTDGRIVQPSTSVNPSDHRPIWAEIR